MLWLRPCRTAYPLIYVTLGEPSLPGDALKGFHPGDSGAHQERDRLFDRSVVGFRFDSLRNQDYKLAADTVAGFEVRPDFRSGPAQHLLVKLRQFARDCDVTLTEDARDIRQGFEDPVWRLIKDERGGFIGEGGFCNTQALALFEGKKPPKWNWAVGRPDTTSAARAAEAPGSASTGIPARTAPITIR